MKNTDRNAEIARRRDAGLLRALKTPPKSHKEMVEERAQKKQRVRRKARAKVING